MFLHFFVGKGWNEADERIDKTSEMLGAGSELRAVSASDACPETERPKKELQRNGRNWAVKFSL